MYEYMREIIAEELGMNPCVLTGSYSSCDGDCYRCEEYKEFEQQLLEEFGGENYER